MNNKPTRPKLSVIVPVYNMGKFLPTCLDALLHQTLKDIEVICVNDGSTDNTQAILDKYSKKDPRVVVVKQENGGLSSSRNTGIEHATTQYIMFCDGDDYYATTMCEKMHNAMSEHDVDFAACGIKNIYTTKYAGRISDDEEYFRIKYAGVQPIDEELLLKTDVSACNKIFKKTTIDQNNLRFPEGLHYEDNFFFLSYACVSSSIYFVNEYLYNYVRHDSGIMTSSFNGDERTIEHFIVAIKFYEFLQEHGLFSRHKSLFWRDFIAYYNFPWRYAESRATRRRVRVLAKQFIKEHKSDLAELPKSLARQVRGLPSIIIYPSMQAAKRVARKTISSLSLSYRAHRHIIQQNAKLETQNEEIISKLNLIAGRTTNRKSQK